VLACNANRLSNIDSAVELLVPLQLHHGLLMEQVKYMLLVIDYGERILIFHLHQHSLLNPSKYHPISILLHLVLKQLRALAEDQGESLSSVFDQVGSMISLGAPLIVV